MTSTDTPTAAARITTTTRAIASTASTLYPAYSATVTPAMAAAAAAATAARAALRPEHRAMLELAEAVDGQLFRGGSLRELGMSAHVFGGLMRVGVLVCVRRGIYVDGSVWQLSHSDERYRMLVRAVSMTTSTPLLLSHLSAAALFGLPIIGPWPRTVHHLTPDALGGSSSPYLTSHRAGPHSDEVNLAGLHVTPIERTLVDVASTQPILTAATMCDHVLFVEARRAAHSTPEQLQRRPQITTLALLEELERVNPTHGRGSAERAIAFATPLSESPGESLSRVRMLELGFEIPDLQEHFIDANGVERRTDCFWRRIRKIGEFDGKDKYLRGGLAPGQTIADKVMQEKRREDALRPQVNSFTRWDWDTAISPTKFRRFLDDHDVPRARRAAA